MCTLFVVQYCKQGVFMASSVLQVRIDESVRKEAENIFHSLGLTSSRAVKFFLNRVIIEQGTSF